MTASDEGRSVRPVIRYAPLGEIQVYSISEHQLEALARGSPASLYLNFALALLPTSITLIVTLITTTVASDRVFIGFVCACIISLISGLVLLVLWWTQRTSSTAIIQAIKDRMPPPEGIQELPGK